MFLRASIKNMEVDLTRVFWQLMNMIPRLPPKNVAAVLLKQNTYRIQTAILPELSVPWHHSTLVFNDFRNMVVWIHNAYPDSQKKEALSKVITALDSCLCESKDVSDLDFLMSAMQL